MVLVSCARTAPHVIVVVYPLAVSRTAFLAVQMEIK